MLTFQQRRDTILSQFAQAKADLETLNSDIDAEIEKIAKAYGMEKDVLKSALRPEDTENITKDIKVQKAVQFIKDNAVEA